jgi:hypothetical protein
MEVSDQLHAPAALPPQGKSTWYPLDRRLGELPERVWTRRRREIPSPRRDSNPDHPIVEPIVSRYTDRAIAALLSRVCVCVCVCVCSLILAERFTNIYVHVYCESVHKGTLRCLNMRLLCLFTLMVILSGVALCLVTF